jgi:hypothetical protein
VEVVDGGMPWWDFFEDARWTRHIYTIVSWLRAKWNTSGVFSLPGVTILSVYPDYMHIKHLGLDKVLLGSVLWLLVNWVLPGNDLEGKMSLVWADIDRIYKEQDTAHRYSNIMTTMFSGTSTPKLKGKAADIKCLVPVLHKVIYKVLSLVLLVSFRFVFSEFAFSLPLVCL